ncbi:MAG: serine protease [Candidatus Electrothrix scaldis]|nr:MAG: serine protease [Candidatus Electrothrix sp. GW3-3]
MKFFATFCCATFSLLLFCEATFAGNNIEFLDKELIQKLNDGIYEVVTPKLEDDKISYARKLPFDKLPFGQRNEKYYSIGTAFFISEKELMTAEHVLGPRYFSLHKDFFIRDRNGKIYPLNNILKCSTRRDMMVFDLKEYPEKITPLHFNRQVEVGDTVFSVGNTLGEGIAYRAGQVASFTPEWDYGEWQDIRFSSPSSPGNSGGPLLNTAGEVIGVIVKGNRSENYNVAVPISEADKLSDKAELYARNVFVKIWGTAATHSRDWSYTVPLPAPLSELAGKARESLKAFYITLRKELHEQVKEKNFPEGKRFRYFLRNQPAFRGLAPVLPDTTFRKWTATQVDFEKEQLAAGQDVYHGAHYGQEGGSRRMRRQDYFDMQVIVEKSPETKLKEFLDSPRMLLETVLKAIPYFRFVGRERIPVTSLGEPEQTETWKDKLGRTWISSLWYVAYDNSFLATTCLPAPQGAVCTVTSMRAGILTHGFLADTRQLCDELLVGYEGSLADWEEYLALGEKYIPTSLQKAEISYTGEQTKIRLKDFQVYLTTPEITKNSNLCLHFGYTNDQLLAEDLILFSLFPEKEGAQSYTIRPYYEPSPFSSDRYRRGWKESNAETGEFSGKKFAAQGDQVVVRKSALQTKTMITDPYGEKIKKIFAVGCSYQSLIAEEKDVEQDCGRFFQSITFSKE